MTAGKTAVVYHKQLGDTLMLQPVIEKLAAMNTPVDVFTLPNHEPLVRIMPGANWRTTNEEKTCHYERVLSFDQSSRSVIRALRLKSNMRFLVARADIYVKWYHRLLFDRCLADGVCVRYIARYYQEMLFGLVSDEDFKPPRLNPPPDEWRQNVRHPPCILINPVSAWERKCWTVQGWRKVIEAVLKMEAGPVCVTGGSATWQQAICHDICAGFPNSKVNNIAGLTTLEVFLVMLAEAPIVLTIDGAASHIAQAFGRPTVTLFGPSKPQMWHFETPHNLAINAIEYSEQSFDFVDRWPTKTLPPTSLIPPERVIEDIRRLLSA